MTLKEIIESRQKKHTITNGTDFYSGYKKGWYWAYQDIKEIFEQNGFDMNVVVIKKAGADNG